MSELTQCNFCSLERIKEHAKDRKLKVTIIPSSNILNGLDVYVHPKDINIHLLREPTRKDYFVSWMWAIGDKCEC
jgi:hypothetical protein